MPLAYSRKFQGLFQPLGYDHVLDAKTLTGAEMLDRLKAGFEARSDLRNQIAAALAVGRARLDTYVTALRALIFELNAAAEMRTEPAARAAPATAPTALTRAK